MVSVYLMERWHALLQAARKITHKCRNVNMIEYSRTPDIEATDLSQSHADLNLSKFQTDRLLRISSSTVILHYLNQYLALQQH